MKIAVLGGTGKMGLALARRLSKANEVIVGSRDPARAKEAASMIEGGVGMDYHGASRAADVVIMSTPYSALPDLGALKDDLKGKLVISMIVPIKAGPVVDYGLREGSAAEELAKILPESRVATAFNNVPRAFLEREISARMDILVAAETKETYEEAAKVINTVGGMRPLYAGPLSQASVVERITPLLVNLASLNGTGVLATSFVSRKG